MITIIIIIIIITLALRRAYLLLLFCGRKSAARAKNTNQKSKLLQTVRFGLYRLCCSLWWRGNLFFESLWPFFSKTLNRHFVIPDSSSRRPHCALFSSESTHVHTHTKRRRKRRRLKQRQFNNNNVCRREFVNDDDDIVVEFRRISGKRSCAKIPILDEKYC